MSIHRAKSADNFRRRATDPEEADPSTEVPVRSRDTAVERLPPVARREPPDLLGQAVDRPLRRQYLDFGGLPMTAETKADEMPVLGSGHGALARVHLEAEPPLDEPHDRRHHPVP